MDHLKLKKTWICVLTLSMAAALSACSDRDSAMSLPTVQPALNPSTQQPDLSGSQGGGISDPSKPGTGGSTSGDAGHEDKKPGAETGNSSGKMQPGAGDMGGSQGGSSESHQPDNPPHEDTPSPPKNEVDQKFLEGSFKTVDGPFAYQGKEALINECPNSTNSCLNSENSLLAYGFSNVVGGEVLQEAFTKFQELKKQHNKLHHLNVIFRSGLTDGHELGVRFQKPDWMVGEDYSPNIILQGISSIKKVILGDHMQLTLVGGQLRTERLSIAPGGVFVADGQVQGNVENSGKVQVFGTFTEAQHFAPTEKTMYPVEFVYPTDGQKFQAGSEEATFLRSGLVINGNYTQKPGAKLEIIPSGSQISLFVKGKVTLAGDLRAGITDTGVKLWSPAIISTESIEGKFDRFYSKGLGLYSYVYFGSPQTQEFTYQDKTYYGVFFHTFYADNSPLALSVDAPQTAALSNVFCANGKKSDACAKTISDNTITQVPKGTDDPVLTFTDPVQATGNITINLQGDFDFIKPMVGFMKGLTGGHTLMVQKGVLVLNQQTYSANVDVHNGAGFVAYGNLEGNATVESGGTLEVYGQMPTEYTQVPTYVRNPLYNVNFLGKRNNDGTLFQYPVGLAVNQLTLKNGAKLSLKGGSVLVHQSLAVETGATVNTGYAQLHDTTYGVVFVLDSNAASAPTLSGTFTDKTGKMTLTTEKTTWGARSVVLVKLEGSSKKTKRRRASLESTHAVDAQNRAVQRLASRLDAQSNADIVRRQAKNDVHKMQLLQEDGRRITVEVQTTSALSAYAEEIRENPRKAQALDGAEFTQTLALSQRLHQYLNQAFTFATLQQKRPEKTQVFAHYNYVSLYEGGGSQIVQLGLIQPLKLGELRFGITYADNSLNSRHPHAGDNIVPSRVTSSGVRTSYSLDLGHWSESLKNTQVMLDAVYRDVRNTVYRETDAKDGASNLVQVGRYGSEQSSVGLNLAKKVILTPQFGVMPFAAYRLTFIYQEGVVESLEKGVNLHVNPYKTVQNHLSLGATLDWQAPKNLVPGLGVDAGFVASYRLNEQRPLSAQVVSSNQSIAIDFGHIGRWMGQVQLGLHYAYLNLNLKLQTQFIFSEHLDYGVGAGVRFSF